MAELKWRQDTPKQPTAWELEARLLDAITAYEEVPDGAPIPDDLAELVTSCLNVAVEKRDALAGAYIRRKAHIAALEERATDAALKAETARRALRRFDAYLLSLLDMAGSKSLPGVQYSIKAKQNPPHVEVDSPAFWAGPNVHAYCKRIPEAWEPSKTKIRDAIEAGEEVPGARLVDGDRRIEIR